jgi:hypothetical protein
VDLVGRTLGPYEIRAHLGRGGVADVYRAVHKSLGAEVALKVLFEESSDDAEQIARFQRESRVLARLSHPGIVEVHDCGNEGTIHYFAMALLEHRTLSALLDIHRVAGGWLPEAQAVAITASILEVLMSVHAENVIHRDLKPSNIFVTSDDQAIVSDFGLVKVVDETSLTAQPDRVLGTIQYMAPEQILSEPADERSDLYAVGLVMHRMLLGCLPFGDQMAEVVQKKTLFGGIKPSVPPNREIALGLIDVIARACRRDRRERFQTAAEFHAALLAVESGAVEPARVRSLTMPVRRPTRTTQAVLKPTPASPRPTGLARALNPPSGAIRRPRIAHRGLRAAVRVALVVLFGAAVGFGVMMYGSRAPEARVVDVQSVAASVAVAAAMGGEPAPVEDVRHACREVRDLLGSDCYQVILANVIEPDTVRFRACFAQALGAVRTARARLSALDERLAHGTESVAATACAARLALYDFLAHCRERSLVGINQQLEVVLKQPAVQQNLLELKTVMTCDATGLARLGQHSERVARLAGMAGAQADHAALELVEVLEDARMLAGIAPKLTWTREVEAAVEQHLRALPDALARAPAPAGPALAAALSSGRTAAAASARGQLTRTMARTAIEDVSTLKGLLPSAREKIDAILSEAWKDLDRVKTNP